MAKFDWVPYFEGKYLSYYQWFALLASAGMFVFAFISFFFYLLLSRIHNSSIHRQTTLKTAKEVSFYSGFFFLSMIPVICQALDVIFYLDGILGMMAVLAVGVYIDNGRKRWVGDSFSASASNWKAFTSLALDLTPMAKTLLKYAAIVSVVVPTFMYKTCLCFYNDQIGYYNHKLGFGINTYLTRMWSLPMSCPEGAPCHIYATIPEDPSVAFFLNVHTHVGVQTLEVYYQEVDTKDPTRFQTVTAESLDYYGLEWKMARRVHSALITGLQPNTKYLVRVYYQGHFWSNSIYKTLPADPSTPVRMINAGDSGYTRASVNLSRVASTLKPDIFFMGGDIAYDDNMPACAYTWDYFLGMYESITSSLNYLMPIVVSVGNHDVGLNELPGVNITINNYGPAFFIYFPQHYDYNPSGQVLKRVPALSRRRSFFSFSFSNVHFMVLDSGYLHGFDGYQKQFMIDAFSTHKDKIKFVNYHVPIYSVCESFDKSPERYLYALFHWVPTFDRFKVMTVFENHVHSFKRTKPLIGNTAQEGGTVYVGDGAYGAVLTQFCEPDITVEIFDKHLQMNNMWLSVVGASKVQHWAYNSTGAVVDSFQQLVETYVPNKADKNEATKWTPIIGIDDDQYSHYKVA